jgi:Glyoxalase-like domain
MSSSGSGSEYESDDDSTASAGAASEDAKMNAMLAEWDEKDADADTGAVFNDSDDSEEGDRKKAVAPVNKPKAAVTPAPAQDSDESESEEEEEEDEDEPAPPPSVKKETVTKSKAESEDEASDEESEAEEEEEEEQEQEEEESGEDEEESEEGEEEDEEEEDESEEADSPPAPVVATPAAAPKAAPKSAPKKVVAGDDDDDDDDVVDDGCIEDTLKKKEKAPKKKVKVAPITAVTEDDNDEDKAMKALLQEWGGGEDAAGDSDDDDDDDDSDQSEREVELEDDVIDHIVLAAPDLEEAMQEFEKATGIGAVIAGSINGLGIKTARISFNDSSYLEIIAPDPKSAGPIGQLLKSKGLTCLTPFHYAIRTSRCEELKDELKKFKYVPDHITMFGGEKDGTPRKWELLFLYGHKIGGICPYFVHWANSPHPCAKLPVVGKLKKFTVRAPEDDPVHSLLEHVNVRGLNLEVGKPKLSFQFSSPEGTIKYATTKAVGYKFPGFDDDDSAVGDDGLVMADHDFATPDAPELLDVNTDDYDDLPPPAY